MHSRGGLLRSSRREGGHDRRRRTRRCMKDTSERLVKRIEAWDDDGGSGKEGEDEPYSAGPRPSRLRLPLSVPPLYDATTEIEDERDREHDTKEGEVYMSILKFKKIIFLFLQGTSKIICHKDYLKDDHPHKD